MLKLRGQGSAAQLRAATVIPRVKITANTDMKRNMIDLEENEITLTFPPANVSFGHINVTRGQASPMGGA